MRRARESGNMKTIAIRCAIAMSVACLPLAVLGELPPPSPAEKVKLEKAAAGKAAMAKQEDEALSRTQERIAKEYRARHPAAAAAHPPQKVADLVKKTAVPKTAK